jgi:hypothetical protein
MARNIRSILLVILVLLLFCIAGYVLTRKYGDVNNNDRYAVFLTNGQIYFGNLTDRGDFLTLENAFYPQSNDFLRSDTTKKKITLQRVGTEVHGPNTSLYINRDQVMYYEKLREDSKVNEAIKKYIDERNSGSPTPTPETSLAPTQ